MRSFTLLVLALAGAVAVCQTRQDSVALAPSNLPDQQLQECLRSGNGCRGLKRLDVQNELLNRMPRMATQTLVACFADWRICGASEDGSMGWPISDEIAKRGNPDKLLARYWTEKNEPIRDGIVDVAYHFSTPEVTAFMKRAFIERKAKKEETYWPANYLAKQCDPDALSWFATRKGRSQSCMQYATTISRFGKCQYRPAIPYLVEYSINDACLNVVDEAEADLRKFFPQSPKKFDSIAAMQDYFCKRAKREGFKVHCD